eukprot:3184249-Pleurochrysis_carterae.AAC.3
MQMHQSRPTTAPRHTPFSKQDSYQCSLFFDISQAAVKRAKRLTSVPNKIVLSASLYLCRFVHPLLHQVLRAKYFSSTRRRCHRKGAHVELVYSDNQVKDNYCCELILHVRRSASTAVANSSNSEAPLALLENAQQSHHDSSSAASRADWRALASGRTLALRSTDPVCDKPALPAEAAGTCSRLDARVQQRPHARSPAEHELVWMRSSMRSDALVANSDTSDLQMFAGNALRVPRHASASSRTLTCGLAYTLRGRRVTLGERTAGNEQQEESFFPSCLGIQGSLCPPQQRSRHSPVRVGKAVDDRQEN